jgi:fumarate hydratase subunit beta
MTNIRHLSMPMSRADARSLAVGDLVTISGEIVITAGLPTHHRLVECARAEREWPRPLTGAGFFHLGSCNVERPDGSLDILYMNPTTSTRFNPVMPELIRAFAPTAVGGKGGLDAACVAAMQDVGCVYLSFLGGGSALLSEAVREVVRVDWSDLIAHFRLVTLRVEGLGPLTVGIDAHGRSLYGDLSATAEARLPAIMADLARAREATG